jgi:hypothetical protein
MKKLKKSQKLIAMIFNPFRHIEHDNEDKIDENSIPGLLFVSIEIIKLK